MRQRLQSHGARHREPEQRYSQELELAELRQQEDREEGWVVEIVFITSILDPRTISNLNQVL